MKKLNAIISWILSICLLAHLLTMGYSLLTRWYDFVICKTLAHATAYAAFAHVILCLIIFLFLHDGASLSYPKKNIRTIL